MAGVRDFLLFPDVHPAEVVDVTGVTLDLLFALERRGLKVLLLSSDSEETIRVTHASHFFTTADLLMQVPW